MVGNALGAILGMIGITRILLWATLCGTYGEHYLVIALTICSCQRRDVRHPSGLHVAVHLAELRSGPGERVRLVATLVDVTGLIIYFSVASIILRGIHL